jgi:hypothetical protein
MDQLTIITDTLKTFIGRAPLWSISAEDYDSLMPILDRALYRCVEDEPKRERNYTAIIDSLKKRLLSKVYKDPQEISHDEYERVAVAEEKKYGAKQHQWSKDYSEYMNALDILQAHYDYTIYGLRTEPCPRCTKEAVEAAENLVFKKGLMRRTPVDAVDVANYLNPWETTKYSYGIRPTRLEGWKDEGKDEFG